MYETLVLLSETVLSAYPILIKKVDATVGLQTGVRMGTFALLAAAGALLTGAPLTMGSAAIAPGLLNLLHVGASYSAFEALPAGNAMALFYTYPVWNLIGAAVAFREKVDWAHVPWMAVAVVGAVLLAQPDVKVWSMFGVVAALVAALTETGIYLWFRKEAPEDSQPWTNMFRMYGSSGIAWALLAVLGVFGLGKVSGKSMSTMLLFNALVGFVGYALRFFAIPQVSTVVFSTMSFFGIVSAYLFGWLFVGEVPNMLQTVGAALIIAANAFLIKRETV